MVKKSTKKESTKFVETVRAFLLEIGAVETRYVAKSSIHDGMPCCDFSYDSKFGELQIYIKPRTTNQSGPGDVMTRFSCPSMAVQVLNCNEFSGKWNHHYFDNWTAETALEDFRTRMKLVRPTSIDTFQDETAVLPGLIAQIVIEDRSVDLCDPLYASERFSHEQAKEWFIAHVQRRVVYLWDNNKRIRQALEKDDESGRNMVYGLVEHWLDGYIHDRLDYRKKHPLPKTQPVAV